MTGAAPEGPPASAAQSWPFIAQAGTVPSSRAFETGMESG